MTDKPAKASAHKIFDVTKPGKTAPSASSKPIIITNRPVLQDPMMAKDNLTEPASALLKPSTRIAINPVQADEANDEPVSPEPVSAQLAKSRASAGETVIQPLSSETQAVPGATPTSEVTPPASMPVTEPASDPAKPEAEKPIAETTSQTETAPEKEAATSDQPEDTPQSESASTAKADEETARKQAERTAELDKLAESRKYYLPINQVEKRKNKRYTLLGGLLIIVLAVVWADVSLDAGIIHVASIKPVTHFFSK